MGVFVGPGVRVITLGMRGAEHVTLFGRRERHERIEHLRVRLPIGPILRNAGPLGAQSLLIGVGILVLRTRAAAFRRCERDLDAVGEFGVLLPFCGNQVEQAKGTVAILRFVGVAVDEAGMDVDKIVDHMSGIQPARGVIHRRVPPRSYGVAILNNLSIEYFPAPVMYSSKKPPIMLRFLKKLSIPSTRSVPVIVQ